MKVKLIATSLTLAATLAAAALGGTPATHAAAKPGLVPGKWIGTGTISGSSTDGGVIGTENRGQIRFALVVGPDRSVSGSGTWMRTMTGAGFDTKSVIVGTASLKFSGPSRDARFVGMESGKGRITAGPVTRPINIPPQKLEGALVLKRAGDCTANGTATIPSRGPGLKLTWTAKRLIQGTCNA